MKGTLHKTENGWVVKYYIIRESSHAIHPNEYALPILDHGYVNGPGLSDSDEGQEVEFKVIEFPVPPTNGPVSNSISKYAQLIDKVFVPMKGGEGWDKILDKAIQDKATRPLTKDDAWLTMKEGDITVNFKPMPEFDDPKYPEIKIICPRCKDIMPCPCNLTWYDIMAESNSHDDSEILAYIIKNYNPPTKKQDNGNN